MRSPFRGGLTLLLITAALAATAPSTAAPPSPAAQSSPSPGEMTQHEMFTEPTVFVLTVPPERFEFVHIVGVPATSYLTGTVPTGGKNKAVTTTVPIRPTAPATAASVERIRRTRVVTNEKTAQPRHRKTRITAPPVDDWPVLFNEDRD